MMSERENGSSLTVDYSTLYSLPFNLSDSLGSRVGNVKDQCKIKGRLKHIELTILYSFELIVLVVRHSYICLMKLRNYK